MPPPKHINVGPYSFPCTPGYSTGVFPITPVELEALDVLRAERLRKKVNKVMEKMRRGTRRTLTEGELRHLTTLTAGFDKDLRLEKLPNPTVAREGRPTLAVPSADPEGVFGAELRALAEARVDAEERARGITLSPEQREAALIVLTEEPLLREQARLRVEVALKEQEKLVADLF